MSGTPLHELVVERPEFPRRWWTLVVLSLGMLLSLVETAVIGVAVPTITKDLHAGTAEIQWILNVFPLAFGGLVITCGGLADRYGNRLTWLVGVAVFGGCSLLATLAADPAQLVVARVGFGVSTALVIPSTFAVIGVVFTDDERPKVTGVLAMVAGIGQTVAPLAGGWLLTNFWWGSIYLVVLPLSVVTFLAGWWLVPTSDARRRQPLDLVGSVLSIAAVTALVWAVTNAPAQGWLATGPVVAIGGGLVLLAAFLYWERRTPNPMMELLLFCRRRYTGSVVAGLVPAFGLADSLFLISQHLQFELGLAPWEVGLAMVPFGVAILLTAGLLSARLARLFGAGRIITVGLALAAVEMLGFALFAPDPGLGAILVVTVCFGVSVGVCGPLTNSTLIGALPKPRIGVGTGVNSTVQQLGGALGAAFIGAVFGIRFAADLPAGLPPEAARSLPAALAATTGQPDAGHLATQVHQAFAAGLGTSLVTGGLVMAIGAAVVALLLRAGPTELTAGT
jgi:EmrB/QacA subfamily drug resistance transporter